MNNNLLVKLVENARKLFGNPQGRAKHFTYILKRKRVVAIGWNLTEKTHPMAAQFGHRANCIHAELMALRNFPYKVDTIGEYDILNIRLLKNKAIACSKPCKACHKMLRSFGVTSLVYSDYGGIFNKMYL